MVAKIPSQEVLVAKRDLSLTLIVLLLTTLVVQAQLNHTLLAHLHINLVLLQLMKVLNLELLQPLVQLNQVTELNPIAVQLDHLKLKANQVLKNLVKLKGYKKNGSISEPLFVPHNQK